MRSRIVIAGAFLVLALLSPSAATAAHSDHSVAPTGVAETSAPTKGIVQSSSSRPHSSSTFRPRLITPSEAVVSSLDWDDSFPTGVRPFLWFGYNLPYQGSLTWSADPAVADLDDVYQVWLEAGEDATFVIDGPDDPAVDYDLYIYPPGSDDFSDPCIYYGDETSDEGIQVTGVIAEGYWYVRVNAHSGSGAYDFYWDFSSPDDDVPGRQFAGAPVMTRLDSGSDPDDVYHVWLTAGETLALRAEYAGPEYFAAGSQLFDPQIHVFAPGTTSVWTGTPVASTTTGSPLLLAYTAPQAGWYFIDLYVPPVGLAMMEYGPIKLTRISAIHRFYNQASGTHFYTPSEEERATVLAKWSNLFTYEGIAYFANPSNNSQPLYRFYNNRNGSHFYTASAEEADIILSRWSNVYSYDGQTYAVNPTPVPNSAPVYRFYNKNNGSHFYTASPDEADRVRSQLSHIYMHEGPAFWVGL